MGQSSEDDCGVPRRALLTVREVADVLRTTPAAIYARIHRKTLPGVTKVGRSTFVRRADLLKSLRLEGRESLHGGDTQ
jgi:excisionase family DNA binding protein